MMIGHPCCYFNSICKLLFIAISRFMTFKHKIYVKLNGSAIQKKTLQPWFVVRLHQFSKSTQLQIQKMFRCDALFLSSNMSVLIRYIIRFIARPFKSASILTLPDIRMNSCCKRSYSSGKYRCNQPLLNKKKL